MKRIWYVWLLFLIGLFAIGLSQYYNNITFVNGILLILADCVGFIILMNFWVLKEEK